MNFMNQPVPLATLEGLVLDALPEPARFATWPTVMGAVRAGAPGTRVRVIMATVLSLSGKGLLDITGAGPAERYWRTS